jgi:hypothetical protein
MVEIAGLGDEWVPDEHDEEHGRGLRIVVAVAWRRQLWH